MQARGQYLYSSVLLIVCLSVYLSVLGGCNRGVEYRIIGIKKVKYRQAGIMVSDIFYENCQQSEIGTYLKKKVVNFGLSILKSSNIGYRKVFEYRNEKSKISEYPPGYTLSCSVIR